MKNNHKPIHSAKIVILISLLLAITYALTLPNCQTNQFYKMLPLTPNEAYYLDMANLFTGYNLRFNVTADTDLQKYLKLTNKIGLQKEQYPDVPLQGLKSLHMAKTGNTWGQQFIALTQKGDKSYIHYGILSDNKTVPVINNYIVVQNFTNTTCYDTLLLPLSNTIVVDCAQKKTSPNSRGQIYQNIFYYFQISDGKKTKQLNTQMYVPFQSIYRRKLDIYQDSQNGHTFVLRTYMADKMAEGTQDNTYVQVIMMQNPTNPWVVGIIDRSFLDLPRLRIVDIKVYQGQIYILDELLGVHRVYISGAEDLIYQNTYEAKGFTRLAVFSPNLDNRIELALANDHSVHEIDWTVVDEPRLVNKYSLMPDSTVIQIFLNDRFLFVRSTATDSSITYSYTWVFTRGDRAFTKAFLTMSHGLSNTLIDVNQALSYILVFNDQALSNYYIDDPSFSLVFEENEDLMDVPRNFVLNTYSTDPSTPSLNITCSIVINFTLLDQNNRTMWEVGSAPPSKFSANYPGRVKIELGDYVLGPNITYTIREIQKDTIKAKVFQNEQLQIVWQKSPPFSNITFLQTETISGTVSDTLMIYMQDNLNNTYISNCFPHHQKLIVHCNKTQVKDLGGQIKDWATTMVINPYSQTEHHLLAYTTANFYNTIFLRDLTSGIDLDQLNLPKSFPGNISSVTISGKYMFVVVRHIKKINIYSLDQCLADNCGIMCNINHLSMFKLGVKFFNPQVVHASRFHPDILFIKTSDSIIAIDLSKECVPKLLSTIHPVQNANTQFIFEVNSNFLVVTIAPNIIQQYDISRIYLKDVRKTKKYPLYGYKLPKNYDFDISDYGNCVYLSTITQGGDYNVFVYRSGLPAVGTLYNQIDLFAYQNLLIDASGYMIDYVTVITSNKQLRIFRQYQKPEAEIQNADKDYDFYLEYHNSLDTVQLEKIAVSIINLPTYIKVNPVLKDIMNTKDYFYSGQNKLSEVNDTDWYKGNVLFIKAECADCPEKIRVNNHIQQEESSFLLQGLTAYAYSENGGDVLAVSTLFKMKTNGSILQIVQFPKNTVRHCSQVSLSRHRYSVIGCTQNNNVYLQVVSSIAKKSFAFQMQQTNANNILRLQATHNLVMLVDTDVDCYKKKRSGGIYLYEISDDIQSSSPLTEIEYIDGDDFNMKELGVINFNNAELIYNIQNKVYRLYISEMQRGLLVMEFTHSPGKGIIVRQVYFIPIRPMLYSLGEALPYDATFQAITLISTSTDFMARKTTERLLITTGRYHTIQLVLTYDFTYSLTNKYIERLYLRYSYYEVINQIKQNGGLFLVRQVLPDQYNNGNQTQQLYTVYSTSGPFNGTVEKRGLIGALTLQENSQHRFDFNKTMNHDDQHAEPRLGLVVVQEGGQLIKASLHRNLSLFTTQLVDTQIIYLDLINDFNLQKIRILLNGRSPYPEWKLITIIIFSILGGFLLIGASFVLFKKLQIWKQMNNQQRETMLSEQTTNNEYQS